MGVVRKYFSLVVEEEYDILSVMEITAYEMTAALSILNILLENGCDRSELSGKFAPIKSICVPMYFIIVRISSILYLFCISTFNYFVFMYFLKTA